MDSKIILNQRVHCTVNLIKSLNDLVIEQIKIGWIFDWKEICGYIYHL